MAGNKGADGGHEVFLELGGVTLAILRSHLCVENHEETTTCSEDCLDELESDPAESVAMRDNNFLDTSADSALQKGDEPAAVEVDTRRDIFNDMVIWVLDNKQLSLALDVFLLFLGEHPAVDDFGPGRLLSGCGDGGGGSLCLKNISSRNWEGEVEHALDVRETVDPLATIPDAHDADPLPLVPVAECRVSDFMCLP